MNDFFHGGDAVLLLLISLVCWVFNRELGKSDKKHEDHYRHSIDMKAHTSDQERVILRDNFTQTHDELLRHNASDEKAFDKVDRKLDTMNENLIEILKYISVGKE